MLPAAAPARPVLSLSALEVQVATAELVGDGLPLAGAELGELAELDAGAPLEPVGTALGDAEAPFGLLLLGPPVLAWAGPVEPVLAGAEPVDPPLVEETGPLEHPASSVAEASARAHTRGRRGRNFVDMTGSSARGPQVAPHQ